MPARTAPLLTLGASLLAATVTTTTLAHEGHVHDEPPAAEAAATPEQTFDDFLLKLAASRVRMETRGDLRLIAANGLPDHATGNFPNRGNPNAITAQQYAFQLPLDPPAPKLDDHGHAVQVRDTRGHLFGVALNGVTFDPGTAENWTAQGLQRGGRPAINGIVWTYEAFGGAVSLGIDRANAHVQPTGAYHYHGIPTPMLKPHHVTLLGYAADGYPVYGPLGHEDPHDSNSPLVELQPSYELKPGQRANPPQAPGGPHDGSFTADWQYVPGSGDLDEANGRFAVTPEYPDGTYHYVLTEAFPHIPRHFAGTPDNSFRKGRGGGNTHERTPRGERNDRRPPRADRPPPRR